MKERMVLSLSDYVLGDMELGHLDEVILIEKLSFKTPWSRDSLEYELKRNKCAKYRVIIKDGIVIGYGGMWVMLDEAHITNIAIHPEYREQGFGSILLEDMISTAKKNGIRDMTLEVRVNNINAISLYKKFGFNEVAIRKGYYQDTGEDAIIMWKYNI